MFFITSAATAQNLQTDFAGGQTLTPPQLPSNVELFNPTSGLYMSLVQSPGAWNNYSLDLQCTNTNHNTVAPETGLRNEYGRLSWHSLEPSEGQYNFALIDNVLAACPEGQTQICSSQEPSKQSLCLPKGVKFSFRVFAFDSQTNGNTNITTGSDGYPVYSTVPAYMMSGVQHQNASPPYVSYDHGWLLPVDPVDATKGHYFVPDWNDPYFLSRVDALLAALGQKYDGDPRIGWVDIGLYGNWGEWHTAGLTSVANPPHALNGYTYGNIPYDSSYSFYNLNTEAYLANKGQAGAYQAGTATSKNSIIDSHVRAFPRTQLVSMTGDGEGLCHALGLPGSQYHIGLRRDSLGSGAAPWFSDFPNGKVGCDTAADVTMITSRWQTAPFVTETAMNGAAGKTCQTFAVDAATGNYYINEEVLQFHIAAVKDQVCAGTWAQLPEVQQQAFLQADLQSGYRFAPVKIYMPLVSSGPVTLFPKTRTFSIETFWSNTGVTPAYNTWTVEFSLWALSDPSQPKKEMARFKSQVDLRAILPTGNTPVVFKDTFDLDRDLWPDTSLPKILLPGPYELAVRVIDPEGYMNPMQLALSKSAPGGYYPLGLVVVP